MILLNAAIYSYKLSSTIFCISQVQIEQKYIIMLRFARNLLQLLSLYGSQYFPKKNKRLISHQGYTGHRISIILSLNQHIHISDSQLQQVIGAFPFLLAKEMMFLCVKNAHGFTITKMKAPQRYKFSSIFTIKNINDGFDNRLFIIIRV